MAPALYKDTNYSLTHLIEDIKHGVIGLPDIQRPFVWTASKTRDLFDSMYRGYPIGTLMFWETGAEVGTRQIGLADHRQGAPAARRRRAAETHRPVLRDHRQRSPHQDLRAQAHADRLPSRSTRRSK